jgi:undecaprenyl-diphosphatase
MIGEIDRNLFLFLNGMNSPFWDEVMWIISAKATWIPLYLFILWLFIRNHGRKTVVIILFVAAAITLSDQLSVHAFKDVFQRLRPCHEPDLEALVHIVRGKCGGKYGFVSSHAANSFSIALFALLLLKRRWLSILLVSWALVVSYSRIYLGVHYPGDILGGAMLGSLTGWLLWYAYCYTESNMLNKIPWFRPGRRQ